jgi:hypothetical protein
MLRENGRPQSAMEKGCLPAPGATERRQSTGCGPVDSSCLEFAVSNNSDDDDGSVIRGGWSSVGWCGLVGPVNGPRFGGGAKGG